MSEQKDLKRIEEEKARWEAETLKPALAQTPERAERFTTASMTPVERLYTPADLPEWDYAKELGFPGEYPYARGVQPTMYRGKLWTMRMFAGYGTADETNRRFKYLLEQGQMGLSTAFDLPTLMGYDSDHPSSAGEVGKCGVAIDSLADMETLFEGIPLGEVTTSMTISSPASVLWAMYIAVCEKQGVPYHEIGGTLQNDILKEYIAQKEYIYPIAPSVRLVTDTILFGAQHLPRWNTVSISGYHIREAGATALQELAFTLADGIVYVEEAIKAGLDVDAFAPRLSFFFDCHNDLFEEVAKFRAARRLWARIMRERFGAKDPRSWLLRTHAQTAGCSLTAQQPRNNIVRVAIQALAAVLGGTQSLHTNAMDEALALPTEEAATIALRTQQIIAHESGVTNTVDPVAGSYYVETLTNQMEEGVWEYFRRIEDLGGMIRAIEKGFPQREIADAAYAYQQAIERGEKVIVGVNRFTEDEEVPIPILTIDREAEARQIERVQALRRARDKDAVMRSLETLRQAAAGNDSWGKDLLMPRILDAVRAYATLGEIMDVFRDAWGEYKESSII
ncbi:methylmalonyl-CoA mutase [Candidatus Methylomirabilis limnetica]|uniref:Methylmalonyl-CoA mutase n=1 Tax=Candidatus Methylomirabilis limnetica TaxID=2033718 RepID=A0A2T4TV57_9BACT|nr:methylmalonyl-CoA mutase family protein [Candidatus Methylomirabilis limnetica]PTL34989.1 methylmalonyl-CoA mutase [Candidatus Methylomirabilis limnetica]